MHCPLTGDKHQQTITMNHKTRLIASAIFLLAAVINANGQTVKGKVTDTHGESVISTPVQVKGTSIGEMTDLDGNFSIKAGPDDILTVTAIGYKTAEEPVRGRAVVNIVLEDDVETLEEVVVVGYGVQKRVNLTGAVGITDAKALETRPVSNATSALQGLVPGLQITSRSGSMEKTPSMNIRGTATIGEGTSGNPLVLIDGMEGDLNTINPQDIESVSVLKDAASASIYGSRAPFGVILVTTKSGKEGKVQINYNNNFRWGSPTVKMHQMDSWSFANYYNEAKRNTSNNMTETVFTEETLSRILAYQQGEIDTVFPLPTSGTQWQDTFHTANANTDWYDVFFKDWNFSHEHNLSASGGNGKVTFYTSLNYMLQEGLLNLGREDMRRYSATGKLNAQLTDHIDLGYSMRFIREDYTKPSAMNDGLYENLARQNWPNLPLYDNNGNPYSDVWPGRDFLQGGTYEKVTDNIYQQLSLSIEPIKNWVTTLEFNYKIKSADTKSSTLKTYNCDIYGNPVDKDKATTSVTEARYLENYLNGNLRMNYSFTAGDGHNLAFMAGAQVENLMQKQTGITAYGLVSDALPEIDLTTGLVWDSASSSWVKKDISPYGNRNSWATAGFFGRINYDWKGRYLVEGNIRYDGTSRYRDNLRWNLYPSISLGWNIANEDFWAPYRTYMDLWKLRASYGSLGNQNTNGWYPTYSTFAPSTNSGSWLQNGVKTTTIGVPAAITTELTWEKVRSWNVGMDFGLFNNRLTGSFDYYTRYTIDMMGASLELPSILGYTTPKTNNTDLMTYGWELELEWKDQLSCGLFYGLKFLLSDSQTIVTKYPSNTTGSIRQYIPGRKLGEIWGYETIGIAKSQEEMDVHLDRLDQNFLEANGYYPSELRQGQSALGSGWGAGDIMYKDLNGDGRISTGDDTIDNHGDLKVIGNSTPRYHFGIDLNLAWKGIDFRMFFQGIMKRDYWQSSSYFWGANTEPEWSAALVQHLDFYRDENSKLVQDGIMDINTDAYYPRPSFDRGGEGHGSSGRNHQVQTRYLQNAAYIRLKNLQLGYTLPEKWTRPAKIERLRTYFSAENIWTGTSLASMFDPETIDGGNNNTEKDWRTYNNGNAYPLSIQLSFGISITF